ncbi:MAG: hypothetical protein QM723_39105 [Myxococcaceae bacterium]
MLDPDGATRVFHQVLHEIGFGERYFGYLEAHPKADASFDPVVEVGESLEALSKHTFEADRRERFWGTKYERGPLSVYLNLAPSEGSLEVISGLDLPGGSSVGGVWHGLALDAMQVADPYFLYNPPYPRLPVTGAVRELVKFVLGLQAEIEAAVEKDGRLLDPRKAKAPAKPKPLAHAVDGAKIRKAFEVAAREAELGVAVKELYREGPSELMAEPAMAKALAKHGFVRAERRGRVTYTLAKPVLGMRCDCYLAPDDSGLYAGVMVDGYDQGTLGDAIVPRREGEATLKASSAAELEALVALALRRFEAFRREIAKTPLPALATPGRVTARWK